MAINYITVDHARQMGAEFLNIVETLRLYQDKLRQHKEIMENLTDGMTYVAIETQYGLPVGKGVTVYNLTTGAVSELAADVNFTQLIDWIVPVV